MFILNDLFVYLNNFISQIVANATYNSAILQLPDYNVNGSLIVGKGFKGCILRGPGILFNDSENNGALIGTCPPELRGCKYYWIITSK